MKLVSERALLTPMNTTQVKTELELVKMQNQIGNLLRHIPFIEMDSVLEEVFTIDVDDVNGHAYDERFAELFALNLMPEEMKQEPVDEDNQRIGILQRQLSESDLVGVAGTSAAAIAGGTMPRINTSPLPSESIETTQQNEKISPATGNSMDPPDNVMHEHERGWFVDLTSEDCVVGGVVYDERFAKYFGLMENEVPNNEIKEEVVDDLFDAFDESSRFTQSPETSDNEEEKQSTSSSSIVSAMENRAGPSVNVVQQSVQDPVSHHYQFVLDVCNCCIC